MIPVLAVIGLIRLIAWICGISYVSGCIRDALTKETGEDIQLSRDDTIEEILDNDDLTNEQKETLITEYLGVSSSSSGLEKYIPAVILGFVALSFLRK